MKNLATMSQEELNQALSDISAQNISRDEANEQCTDLLREASQARDRLKRQQLKTKTGK